MWRQTLRFVPSYRGSPQKVNYGQLLHQSTQQQPSSSSQSKRYPDLILNGNNDSVNKFPEFKEKQPPPPKEDICLKDIELVPPNLQRYLFPNVLNDALESGEVSDELLAQIILPELEKSVEKNGLMAHFDEIGKQQFASYEELLEIAAQIEKPPKMPKEWSFTAGWTRYNAETGSVEAVPYPDEKILFFDVEVCVPESKLACLAVAMSPTSWYSWCSDRLVNNSEVPKLTRLEHMIPLEPSEGTKEPKIVIGHNVGFDRARVREQYYSEKTPTRFWDTMSMNIAVFGMAEHQRLIYETTDLKEDFYKKNRWVPAWRSRVSKNSLGAVHAKLCGDSTKLELNKSMQDVFVKEDIQTIRDMFQDLTTYCAEDVLATCEVYQKLYPIFKERFPHPITYVGMMEMGSAYLPITDNWRNFYEKCNEETSKRTDKAAQGLAQASIDICQALASDNDHESDPWMWICEWKQHAKLQKPKWYLNLFSSREKLPTSDEDVVSSADIKFRGRDVPRIFGICYGPFPLHYKADFGWGYLVPNSERSKNYSDFQEVKTRRGDTVKIPNKAIVELIEKNRAQGIPELPLPESPASKVGSFKPIIKKFQDEFTLWFAFIY